MNLFFIACSLTLRKLSYKGASIDVLTATDDALVEPDDDFGFNGSVETFFDSKSYSPTQQKDI